MKRTDEFHVVPEGGDTITTSPHQDIALVKAQMLAFALDNPGALLVMRRYTRGPSVVLYRVQRDEDGAVITHTINRED